MATLFKRLPVAPDPSLQEPAGESELDSLYHRPSHFGLGTDWAMPPRGPPSARCEIPNDTHFPDTRHLDYSVVDDAAATVSRSRSPSPSSDDDHDYAFDGLHRKRKPTSPPTPECDGSPAVIGMFEFWGKHERAPTFPSALPNTFLAPPGDRSPPKRRRLTSHWSEMVENKVLASAMLEREGREEDIVTIHRPRGYFHLSCPFYVSNPNKYQSCLVAHDLQSIEDVINHVAQHHKEPSYCYECGLEFESLGERDRHVLKRTCCVQNSSEVDSINERQPFWLHKRDAVQLGERRRWSHIRENVFPRILPLKPSYLCEIRDKAMAMINDYWANADMVMPKEQLNDLPRLYSFNFRIPGAFYGVVVVWDDSYNEGRKEDQDPGYRVGGKAPPTDIVDASYSLC